MDRKRAYATLELPDNAALADVKRAYRRLAFSLHPDLNPDKPGAAASFQKVNEAYVYLGDLLKPATAPGSSSAKDTAEDEATARARAEAKKAYKAAQARVNREEKHARATGKSAGNGPERDLGKDEVLRDLLRDPFARRVFEDIYSQIRHDSARNRAKPKPGAPGRSAWAGQSGLSGRAASGPAFSGPAVGGAVGAVGNAVGKAVDSVQNWMRRRIDDEQTVYLPAASLVPGARVRLQIRHGLSEKPQTIEVTLPPEFQMGRPIRLKGMGRHLGSWKGDLYLTILPKKNL